MNAYLEQKCKKFNHDENVCFKQFVNEIVKIRNFIENELFDDRKNFRFCNVRKALNRIKIKKSRNIDQINR